MSVTSSANMNIEDIYDDLYNIEQGRADLDRRNAVFKFQSPVAVVDVDSLDRKKTPKKRRSSNRAPVQFSRRHAPKMQPPIQMTQQRPNELKYLYTVPIRSPRVPRTATPRQRRSRSSRPRQQMRTPNQSRTQRLRQQRHPAPRRQTNVAPRAPRREPQAVARGSQDANQPRDSRNAATQADFLDGPQVASISNTADAATTPMRDRDMVFEQQPQSLSIPNVVSDVGDQAGVLDGARTHELPEFHERPAPAQAATTSTSQGLNSQESQPNALSSQLALQMILQTLTQQATKSQTQQASTNNATQSPGINLDQFGELDPHFGSQDSLHTHRTPVERDFYSPGTLSWSCSDNPADPRRQYARSHVATHQPDLSPVPPSNQWYTGAPVAGEQNGQSSRDILKSTPPAMHRGELVSSNTSTEDLLVQLCIESFRQEAAQVAQQRVIPAEELLKSHKAAVEELALRSAQIEVSEQKSRVAEERLQMKLEQQQLQSEQALADERQRMNLQQQEAMHLNNVLRGELQLKEAALAAREAELAKAAREQQWALERSQLQVCCLRTTICCLLLEPINPCNPASS